MIKKLEGIKYRRSSFLVLLAALSTLVLVTGQSTQVFAQPISDPSQSLAPSQGSSNSAPGSCYNDCPSYDNDLPSIYSEEEKAYYWHFCAPGPDVIVQDVMTGLLLTGGEIYAN